MPIRISPCIRPICYEPVDSTHPDTQGVNDPNIRADAEIQRMREIIVAVDEATTAAYEWDDVPLGHGFYTYRQMERFTLSPAARVEILDRLLAENHRRARSEGKGIPNEQSVLF